MTDDHSFVAFVRDRGPTLYRYGYVLTGNSHDADDLVQDALIRLRGAWSRIDRTEDPTGYVRTTMARLHISAWRRRRREWLTSSVPERAYDDRRIDRADAEASRDAEGSIWALLKLLPPRQRAVLVLRYYEHLSDAEIAEVLGVSSATIRSQASRAMAKLRSAAIPELAKEARA